MAAMTPQGRHGGGARTEQPDRSQGDAPGETRFLECRRKQKTRPGKRKMTGCP